MEDLTEQFRRLDAIARSASEYLFPSGHKYTGPIGPAGIIAMTGNPGRLTPKDGQRTVLFLVLSEHVPTELFGCADGSEPYPTGIALVKLSNDCEFANWTPQTKTLGYLQAIFWCSDGTMEAACAEETGRNFTWEIIYKPGRQQPKPQRSPTKAKSFDPDEYRSGGWRTAVEKQFTHYQRLGLDSLAHVSAAEVGKAHNERANWWRQRGAQAQSGKNNPLIAELAPFITTAEENLQQAFAVLMDVDRKSAYDRQLQHDGAKAKEEKLHEFIRFTLRDRILTPTERNDLLNQAQELGILRERAEELIQQEMKKAGAIDGADPSAGLFPQRDVPTPVVQGGDSPRLALSQTSVSLGTLRRGEKRECRVTIDNRGGGVLAGSIHSSHPDWLSVSPAEIDSRRHHQELHIHIDTSSLALGKSYVGAVEILSNGGRESIRVDLSIELEAKAVSRYRNQLFWIGAFVGLMFGFVVYGFISPASTAVAMTQIAGLIGFVAFVVVCAKAGRWGGGIGGFFLASIVQSILTHISMHGYSAAAWAEIASAFLYFWAKPLLIAKLSGDSRTRTWAAVSGFGLITAILLIGIGVSSRLQTHPSLASTKLPAEDKFIGSSIGSASGIHWTHALGDSGAVFSAADSSRIEYPGLIPPEGTLEFWIKVDNGYQYSNYQFKTNQNDAMIFSSDVQGGDVTWPGTTKVFVTRNGGLSIWMATVKGANTVSPTEARKTAFRFGEWHAIGVSYGRHGQYIMLDGKLVASAPGRTQTFGVAGNQASPLDIPTIGETASHFWQHHRYEGGFEGTLTAFRVSPMQSDWVLAKGIAVDSSVPSEDAAPTTSQSSTDASHGDEPHIESVSTVLPKDLQTITITGRGFGTHEPYTGDSDYIRASDLTTKWNAGWAKDPGGDKATLVVSSWTGTEIVLFGFAGAYGRDQNVLKVGDDLSFQVWNPQTGQGPASYTIRVPSDTTTAGSTDSAIAEMISQWAAAHAANDVEAEIAFYASMVDPYYDRRNVPREVILEAQRDLLSKGVRLSRYEATNVTVVMNGDSDATVNLEKIWSTRVGDSIPHHTRSELHVRSFDGRWLIAGEKDL